jgi:dihydroxyacid dehydratase/phosphogluconate dehydratase
VVLPLDKVLKPRGGMAILHGSLAPEGCVIKLAGHERRSTKDRRACSIAKKTPCRR